MRAAHGWLPAVVPARARRFRVADAELAAALTEAGAELVESGAEVEIAAAGAEIHGDAELAIVTVVGPESRAGPRLVRAARRAAHSLLAQAEAARARRLLRRKGYAHVEILRWDLPGRVRLPRLTEDGPRLPRYALVVGRHRTREPTAVESALDAAAEHGLEPRWASTRAGLVVLAVNGSLLRVAIGPTSAEIDNGIASLEALRSALPPPEVADLVPWPLSRGRVGLADWSLECLLAGTQPQRAVSGLLFNDCLAFLQRLGRLRSAPAEQRTFSALARTVEEVCAPETARELRAVADRLERRLEGVPRCFAHGDFFAGNLLENEAGRLSGVVDWDAAGPGRLPLLDLLHLQLTRSGPFADEHWGRTLLARLLPLARAGGDEHVRHYCREVGLDPDASLLEALVFAYWLDHAAYQLRAHPVRRVQPAWIEGNVELVVRSAAEALAR